MEYSNKSFPPPHLRRKSKWRSEREWEGRWIMNCVLRHSKSARKYSPWGYIQRWAKMRRLGCVNLHSKYMFFSRRPWMCKKFSSFSLFWNGTDSKWTSLHLFTCSWVPLSIMQQFLEIFWRDFICIWGPYHLLNFECRQAYPWSWITHFIAYHFYHPCADMRKILRLGCANSPPSQRHSGGGIMHPVLCLFTQLCI